MFSKYIYRIIVKRSIGGKLDCYYFIDFLYFISFFMKKVLEIFILDDNYNEYLLGIYYELGIC